MNYSVRKFDQAVHYLTVYGLILPFIHSQLQIKKPRFDRRLSNIELLDEQIFKQDGLPVWNFVQTIRYLTVDGHIFFFLERGDSKVAFSMYGLKAQARTYEMQAIFFLING